jgi:hypothetical protein
MLLDSAHRRWLVATILIFLVATAFYVPYHLSALNGPSGGSFLGLVYGFVGLAFMLYAGVLGARRKVPMWRLGRATTWMKGHLWLGLVSYPIIIYHSGFQLGGSVTLVLMILFTFVILSGIFGLVLQQYLPRLLLDRVPLETVYEQIDNVVVQLRTEADDLVAAAAGPLPVAEPVAPTEPRGGGGLRAGEVRPTPRPKPITVTPLPESAVLKELYVNNIRPFLSQELPRNGRLSSNDTSDALFAHLRTTLPPLLHPTVEELEAICDERRQLAVQKRLHHWLHGWLLVHVPISLALLLLSVVHAVVALRY